MAKSIHQIRDEAVAAIEAAADTEALIGVSITYLGRKGLISQFLRNISQLPSEQRPQAGQAANAVKKEIAQRIDQAKVSVESQTDTAAEALDISAPGRPIAMGTLHPITLVMRQMCNIFVKMGFAIAEGPEIESDYYNFEALNFPKEHPARDMQDTFFVSSDIVLRTHTSPLQVRVMEKQEPPVRVIAPGRVFRCDSDITHTPMFHQVEGLMVDKNVSFGDLKGILETFVHEMFDKQTDLRFRPSFFPFTEPSAEVDIRCVMCRGSGCRICSKTGWLEILGSGMVHPAVLENVNYDTDRYTGFAFGMGVERIAMLKYGIDDLRRFFENDIRFTTQFH